jgi:hypothetical protein
MGWDRAVSGILGLLGFIATGSSKSLLTLNPIPLKNHVISQPTPCHSRSTPQDSNKTKSKLLFSPSSLIIKFDQRLKCTTINIWPPGFFVVLAIVSPNEKLKERSAQEIINFMKILVSFKIANFC